MDADAGPERVAPRRMRNVPFPAVHSDSRRRPGRSGIREAPRALMAACLLAAGCGSETPYPSAEAAATPHSSPRATVSLSPAISATLADLGVADAVVGRTPWCWAIPEAVPAVGSLLEIDYERLIAARPAVVLVQPGVGGVDRELVRLGRERGWTLASWRLDRLADVEAMLDGLGGVPPVAGDAAALGRLAARRAEIAALRAAAPGEDAVRVLLLVSADPPTAAAEATFLDELLRAAGGRNALAGRTGYIGLSLEEVAALAPPVTVLLRDEPPGHEVAPPAALVAAAGGRVEVVACREAFLPSSLAPVAAAAIRAGLADRGGGVAP